MNHTFKPLDTTSDLEALVEESHRRPVVLFKHSSMCGTSFRAQHEMSKLKEDSDPPVYRLTVQKARNLSFKIQEMFGVRHESPQMLIIRHGTTVRHDSHFGVTASAARKAVEDLPQVHYS